LQAEPVAITVIRVPIVRWVEDHQPPIVECRLTDASGRVWSFINKIALFSDNAYLNENSEYPQPGILACEIVEEKVDSRGRKISVINTGKPWGIRAVDGSTRFEVLQEQIEIICSL
jgi:hypothetical protein